MLEADLPAPTLDDIEGILIDEKPVRRGHQDVTLVLNTATGEFRHVLEGQRFNLLRHPENLAPAGEIAPHGMLDINRNLQGAYLLKDQFRLVWTYTKPGWARQIPSTKDLVALVASSEEMTPETVAGVDPAGD